MPNQTSRKSLNSVSVSINTEMVSKATAVDCSTNTESKHSNDPHLTFGVLHSVIQCDQSVSQRVWRLDFPERALRLALI
jgi:hypothetical protein